MKTLSTIICLVLVCIGCTEERLILKSIEGRWRISSITYFKGSASTSFYPDNSYLICDPCAKFSNNNSRCSIQYIRQGQPYKYFYHTIPSEDGSLLLVIRLNDKPGSDSTFVNVSKEILGSYRLLQDRSKITLRCEDCLLSQVGYTNHTAKEIVLVK